MIYVAPKDGSAIAEELGITRQAVSNTLKRAMKKFYKGVQRMDSNWGPFECSCSMMKMMNINHTSEEIKKFYNLFPPEIRKEIEADALKNYTSARMREKYGK